MEVVSEIDVKKIAIVANKFNAGFMDRQNLAINLCEITDECFNKDKQCLNCPVPQVVQAHFTNPIVSYLKNFLYCLRPKLHSRPRTQ